MCTHQCNQLAFAYRNPLSSFTCRGLESVWQRGDPITEAQRAHRLVDVGVAGTRAPEPDVLSQRLIEEEPVLGDHPHDLVPALLADAAQVQPTDANFPIGWVGETREQQRHRALATTCFADDGNCVSCLDPQAHIVQHDATGAIGKLHAVELNSRSSRGQRLTGVSLFEVDVDVEHLHDLPPAGEGGLCLIENFAELGDWLGEQCRKEDEAGGLTHTQRVGPEPDAHDDDGSRGQAAEKVHRWAKEREELVCVDL